MPSAFKSPAALTAVFATLVLNVFPVVGTPSVKKMTTVFASSRAPSYVVPQMVPPSMMSGRIPCLRRHPWSRWRSGCPPCFSGVELEREVAANGGGAGIRDQEMRFCLSSARPAFCAAVTSMKLFTACLSAVRRLSVSFSRTGRSRRRRLRRWSQRSGRNPLRVSWTVPPATVPMPIVRSTGGPAGETGSECSTFRKSRHATQSVYVYPGDPGCHPNTSPWSRKRPARARCQAAW